MPTVWVGWLRLPHGRWKQVATGSTYAEAAAKADKYLATMDDPPMHAEVYVGALGNRPPPWRRSA